ncbi:hypothetical protein [Cyprinid herpesvirus 2]|nr:hypothetical protein [Cyprinid herpesvirus 2]
MPLPLLLLLPKPENFQNLKLKSLLKPENFQNLKLMNMKPLIKPENFQNLKLKLNLKLKPKSLLHPHHPHQEKFLKRPERDRPQLQCHRTTAAARNPSRVPSSDTLRARVWLRSAWLMSTTLCSRYWMRISHGSKTLSRRCATSTSAATSTLRRRCWSRFPRTRSSSPTRVSPSSLPSIFWRIMWPTLRCPWSTLAEYPATKRGWWCLSTRSPSRRKVPRR